jgi:hypothetical protein
MTTLRAVSNTFSTNVSGGTVPGDAATGHFIRDVHDIIARLEPQDTPLLTEIGFGEPLNQRKPEWLTGRETPHIAELEGAIADNVTTINVVAGQGARFQKYQKIYVYNHVNTADVTSPIDYATKEEMWVSAEPSTDALTVVRAQGGTTAKAFADGAFIDLGGPAEPEGQDHVLGPYTYGTFAYNHFGAYVCGHRASIQALKTPNLEIKGDQMAYWMKEKAGRMKLGLEKDIVQGGRQAGNPTTPLPSMMGGWDTFITDNVTNLNGNVLTLYDLENEGAGLWQTYRDTSKKRLVMNATTTRMFDGTLNPYRQGTLNDDSVNIQLRQVKTRFGNFEIEPTPWVPDGVIYGVDLNDMKLHPYEGGAWQEKEHATDGHYRWRSVYGEYTLIVKRPQRMFKIYGFNTDLLQYDRQF